MKKLNIMDFAAIGSGLGIQDFRHCGTGTWSFRNRDWLLLRYLRPVAGGITGRKYDPPIRMGNTNAGR